MKEGTPSDCLRGAPLTWVGGEEATIAVKDEKTLEAT